jgi:hypothetical protein
LLVAGALGLLYGLLEVCGLRAYGTSYLTAVTLVPILVIASVLYWFGERLRPVIIGRQGRSTGRRP